MQPAGDTRISVLILLVRILAEALLRCDFQARCDPGYSSLCGVYHVIN